MYDAAVVGGGPAGLAAALYLARFHLSVFLADAGNSRAALIPKTHNQPFWPEGISGIDLLDRMRSHLIKYPIDIVRSEVAEIRRGQAGFELAAGGRQVICRAIVLATGAVDRRPRMSESDHSAALHSGLLRYCAICDGYEATDRAIAVVGMGDRLYGEAKFLRSYTSTVTALSETGLVGLSSEQHSELAAIGVEVIDKPVIGYRRLDRSLEVLFLDRGRTFESLYAALGSVVQSRLAAALGAKMSEEGCLLVDEHQRTSVRGLYAAGDVVIGVDQISHAIGQAGVAATALRNDLCGATSLLR
ncbi:NAD(P)/FAD-dependent oxidoreductase [Rhizobium herbae]|uniref:Thioredoxin reductase n=1 Tax=Rhizobium herbae TaxID=508661 RepID=A0ABS7HDR0_9HYPH|nr:NAD(P)/FAD-dependent oxidoreductase [Rhizobium herbae]MBW9064393.1 NAD(P)/FAD-dependent oxidoreductase [Rhizobium herbae]